jgi:hypothetical protein
MSPIILPTESISGLWELICFAGTLLSTLFVWVCSLR